jgi:hypothetical protein
MIRDENELGTVPSIRHLPHYHTVAFSPPPPPTSFADIVPYLIAQGFSDSLFREAKKQGIRCWKMDRDEDGNCHLMHLK